MLCILCLRFDFFIYLYFYMNIVLMNFLWLYIVYMLRKISLNIVLYNNLCCRCIYCVL